jgi:hypothetical protein
MRGTRRSARTSVRIGILAEPALVAPELIVVPGATAGKALSGSSFRVAEERGTVLEREIHGRPERGGAHRSIRRPCCGRTTGKRRTGGCWTI